MLRKTIVCLVLFFLFAFPMLTVTASESITENVTGETMTETVETAAVTETELPAAGTDEDDWTENEITNTFYMPKSRFQSSQDYMEYCQRMYNNGYMDEYYNWTDEAQDYINNPTKEKSEALDESAKALVEQRVAEGKMNAWDNPFLTYEEREALKEEAGAETETGTLTETENIPETENSGEGAGENSADGTGEPEETTRSETETETEMETGNGSAGKFIMAAILTAAVMVAYCVYRKRNP